MADEELLGEEGVFALFFFFFLISSGKFSLVFFFFFGFFQGCVIKFGINLFDR